MLNQRNGIQSKANGREVVSDTNQMFSWFHQYVSISICHSKDKLQLKHSAFNNTLIGLWLIMITLLLLIISIIYVILILGTPQASIL